MNLLLGGRLKLPLLVGRSVRLRRVLPLLGWSMNGTFNRNDRIRSSVCAQKVLQHAMEIPIDFVVENIL